MTTIYHTPECTRHRQAIAAESALRAAQKYLWEQRWPQACSRCSAHGILDSSQTRDQAQEVSTFIAELYNVPDVFNTHPDDLWVDSIVYCGQCLKHRRCPRCAGVVDWTPATDRATFACPYCAWSFDHSEGMNWPFDFQMFDVDQYLTCWCFGDPSLWL